jgi:formylglycine-generating enzyme required for sulfatase activity/MinD-like ATPase involved in chromosome partitioning or flagellar assembly
MEHHTAETSAPLHEVITFYSYKGGTGRTMALANIACLFASQREQPRRVLTVDWDLEAPGLHYYLRPLSGEATDPVKKGVVEYFTRVQELVKDGEASSEDQDAQAESLLEQISFVDFVRATSVPNVDLMPAGHFDASYQSRLAELDWHRIYKQAPAVFRCFARRLATEYDVVLVDSRTGMTDISGICTSLLPDKLVVVFTPNRQSLTGIENLVQSSVKYRQGSRDLRPLLVYPLPSRIDAERDKLRQIWRHGESNLRIEGYQPQFQRIFKAAYALDHCDLSNYCDEVQVQHSPDYSYGEEVAAINAHDADRFSIVRSYQALLAWLQASAAPWESPETALTRKRLDSLLKTEAEAIKQPLTTDLPRIARLQEEILALASQQRGPLHRETISIMERLIETYLLSGDTSQGCELLMQLATSLPELRMPVRVNVIGTILTAAARLRPQEGLAETAERLKRFAIDSLETEGENPDLNSISLLEMVGRTLRESSALTEARALQENILLLQHRLHGEENTDTLTSMSNLAETLRALGELTGARALEERVLEVRRRVLGEEHPDTLSSMGNLAMTLKAQGELASERALEERVLEVRRRVLGEEHPDTLTSMDNLAMTLKAQGMLAGERTLEERVLEVRRRVLGEEHPDTLSSMGNLAMTLKAQGELAGQRALEERVLEVRRRVLGEEHPETLASMGNLAETLKAQGELAGARALEERVLEVRRRVLGEEHPETLTSSDQRHQLFISYSHVDRKWVVRLQTMIRPLVRSHGLLLWDDSQISPGAKWREEIETALDASKVALLLVSSDFLASEFVTNSELPQLLAAAEEEGLRILWVPVRPSLVSLTPIYAYQALLDPGRPLASMKSVEQDEALLDIAQAIAMALAPHQNSPSAAAKTRGDSAGGPRQAATPRSGTSVFPSSERQASAADRSGATQPEMAQPEAAEPPLPNVALQRFTTSTCLLRQEGGRWSMERRPLQVEGYREDLNEGVAITMVKIPAGSFLMGSPEDELDRSDVEGPQYEVRLGAFWMAQAPITQAQWRAVSGWQKVERDLKPDPSRFKGANRPVERVSWLDALEFCRRLNQRTGQRYGLPSEAQWEYACRAGSTTPFHFGATLTQELANYDGSEVYGNGPKGAYRDHTIDVASFPANGWGLHDMHGNVWELCEDHWHDSYIFAPGDDRPWLIPAAADNEPRLLRGGSWFDVPGGCRSACRYRFGPDDASDHVGFRVVCLPQGPSLNP